MGLWIAVFSAQCSPIRLGKFQKTREPLGKEQDKRFLVHCDSLTHYEPKPVKDTVCRAANLLAPYESAKLCIYDFIFWERVSLVQRGFLSLWVFFASQMQWVHFIYFFKKLNQPVNLSWRCKEHSSQPPPDKCHQLPEQWWLYMADTELHIHTPNRFANGSPITHQPPSPTISRLWLGTTQRA